MRRLIAAASMLTAGVAPVAALTVEDLQGITIQMTMNYDMRIRRAEGTFNTQMMMAWKFMVDEFGRIIGDITRTVTTPRGPRSQTNKMRGLIGKAGDAPTGGQGVWLIEGDKLVLLRAFDAGGLKVEIEFAGSRPDSGKPDRCTVRAPFVREEGAGDIRSSQSVVGGPVTILSATQKTGDCRLNR